MHRRVVTLKLADVSEVLTVFIIRATSLVLPLLVHLSEIIGQPAYQSLEMNHLCIELHFVLTYTESAFKLWYIPLACGAGVAQSV
jgi:hypothetical protein